MSAIGYCKHCSGSQIPGYIHGPLAHLVERLICNEEVTGSIPVGSTVDRKIPLERDFLRCGRRSDVLPAGKTARQGRAAMCATAYIERLTTKAQFDVYVQRSTLYKVRAGNNAGGERQTRTVENRGIKCLQKSPASSLGRMISAHAEKE